MNLEAEVKKLSRDEQLKLIIAIIRGNKEVCEALEIIVPSEKGNHDMAYIEKLIAQDFERYDEVFKALA